MGIAYVAAAFGVVPGLLLLFNRLSRQPERAAEWRPGEHDDVPFADPGTHCVADEAERWLKGQV